MHYTYLILITLSLCVSCSRGGNTADVPATNDSITADQNKEPERADLVSHQPCSFTVGVPVDWKITAIEEETAENIESCDYSVKTPDGTEVLTIHSALHSHFESRSPQELYDMAVKFSKFRISYKKRDGNWFVISGVNGEKGSVIYWKRIIGERFISDLYFDYPPESKETVEPFIDEIAASFKSE